MRGRVLEVGRAIIASDAQRCRETVIDGENGFLVKSKDVNSLYEAMICFVEEASLAITMGETSRKIAESKYDVRKVNATLLSYAGL